MSANRNVSRVSLLVVSAALLLVTACSSATSTGHTAARPTSTAHPAAPAASGAQAPAGGYLGLVRMGMPDAPQPFMSDEIAITKHSHAFPNDYFPPAIGFGSAFTADHGADCGPPPATHRNDGSYAATVFVCHDHLMTSADAVGTSVVSLQPNQLVDFSKGPATVSISVSTFRTSNRDWLDFYFEPFAEQTAYTNDNNTGEELNAPQDYIRVREDTAHNNDFVVTESVGGVQRDLTRNYAGLLDVVAPSKTIRTPITFTISQTHFGISGNGHVFYDTDLPVPFPISRVVFQAEQVNYNPASPVFLAEENTPEQAALGLGPAGNTWHWSNLSISSAVPYYQQMAMPDAVGDAAAYDEVQGLGNRISFAPAPAGAFLRFIADDHTYGNFAGFAISFDGGKTWKPLARQDHSDDSYYGSFLQPIPQGATSAILRGTDHWYARDFYVMSLAAQNAP
jgi:hypothetical protein